MECLLIPNVIPLVSCNFLLLIAVALVPPTFSQAPDPVETKELRWSKSHHTFCFPSCPPRRKRWFWRWSETVTATGSKLGLTPNLLSKLLKFPHSNVFLYTNDTHSIIWALNICTQLSDSAWKSWKLPPNQTVCKSSSKGWHNHFIWVNQTDFFWTVKSDIKWIVCLFTKSERNVVVAEIVTQWHQPAISYSHWVQDLHLFAQNLSWVQ